VTDGVWELHFDGHPPSQNVRMHWRTRAKHASHWRTAAKFRAILVGIPCCDRVRITPTVIRPRLGVADADNDMSRCKPLVDGLVDAGVVPRDSYAYVEWGRISETRGPRGIRLMIERIDPEPA
jgi:crossover junction endodeoxyribonuclease RusA